MDYKIIEKKEILNEVAAGIIARFSRVLDKKNIDFDDNNNSLIIMYKMAISLKDNIIGGKSKTMEDLNTIKDKFEFIDQYIEKLN